MKIGEFAKKHQVTIDTVRHYINEGLLSPLKENTQYSFSEIDDGVMESILLLKSMNFKLDEMKAFLLFQTMYTGNSFHYLGSFRREFEEKLAQNREEIRRLEWMNRQIEQRLGECKNIPVSRGIALGLLAELICPDCEENLELEQPKLVHNEIIEGQLVCPKCGKTYFIRCGILSDAPIDEIEDQNEDLAKMMEEYLKNNDADYILQVRALYQKAAEMIKENSAGAKNVGIEGQSSGFLNSAILRSIPRDARLFVFCGENFSMKFLLEDSLPKETIFYSGSRKNVPFAFPMDYLFWQDYDMDTYFKKSLELYPVLSETAKLNCAKALLYGTGKTLPDETEFLADMRKLGWQETSVYKTEKIQNKKESTDMSIIEKKDDMQMQYGIYAFSRL
jgi:DNA-binding transcriptional MerR regulator/uncharacterized protein YbaR (Trm112 family)